MNTLRTTHFFTFPRAVPNHPDFLSFISFSHERHKKQDVTLPNP